MPQRSDEIKPYVTIPISKYKELLSFVPDNMKPTFQTKLTRALEESTTDDADTLISPNIPKSETLLEYSPPTGPPNVTALPPLPKKKSTRKGVAKQVPRETDAPKTKKRPKLAPKISHKDEKKNYWFKNL